MHRRPLRARLGRSGMRDHVRECAARKWQSAPARVHVQEGEDSQTEARFPPREVNYCISCQPWS